MYTRTHIDTCTLCWCQCVNPLRSNDAYMRRQPRASLFQAIIWTNAGILLIGPLGTNFSEIVIEIYIFSFKEMHLKMSSGKWHPFCLGLNVLNIYLQGNSHSPCRQHLLVYYVFWFHVWRLRVPLSVIPTVVPRNRPLVVSSQGYLYHILSPHHHANGAAKCFVQLNVYPRYDRVFPDM